MADQVSSLVFRVDATQAEAGARSLDQLTAAAERAEAAQRRLASAGGPTGLAAAAREAQQASAAMTGLAQASARVEQSTRRAASAHDAERAALARLLGDIDPVTRALDRLDRQQQELNRARTRGLIDNDTFNEYNKRLEESRQRMSSFTDGTQQMGMSAAQAANNLRMLPAQITDITVGLATGQAPMMVFLQQGGQLKDIFGGVGPALRAVGGYIAGLITPLTLAGAALAAFGLAAYKGSQESQALREALILSGNAIGQSADGLAEMAQRMAAIDGTVGRASATLAAFARSARIPADALEESARAAQTWARATGQSVEEVIDEFNEIGRDPVDALMRLNEQYNFLDAATLQRIQQLQRQGREEEAVALAQRTYSNMLQQRGDEVIRNLGLMERAWGTLASVAKSAWDAMLAVGREDTLAQTLEQAQFRLRQLEAGPATSARRREQIAAARAEVERIQGLIRANEEAAKAEGERQRVEREAIDGLRSIESARTQYATREEQRQLALREAQDARNKALAASSLTAEQRNKIEADYAAIVAGINKQFEERNKGGIAAAARAEGLTERLKQQNAVLAAQLEQDEKLGAAQRRQIEYEQRFADLKERRTLTAQERVLLAQEDTVRALLAEGVELERTIARRDALLKLSERAASVMSSLQSNAQNRVEQYEREEGAFGLGERLRRQVEAENSIRREFNRAQAQLTRDLDLGLIEGDEVEQRRQQIREFQEAQLDELRAHYDRMEALEMDWSLSFQSSIADAADAMRTSFQIAGAATQTVFQGLSSGLANFVTTGKSNFADLTRSILSSLAQIAAQAAASRIFGLIGSFFTPGDWSSTNASNPFSLSSMGLIPPGRATGGPTAPNSLYRVNERGPELYSENGKTFLMSGANGGYVTPITAPSGGASMGGGVTVNVRVDGNGVQAESNDERYRSLGVEIGNLVDERIKHWQIRGQRPGGIGWAAQNGRLA